ncbi:MAG TPA: radical SAM family heme chaperone HemW [Nitrosomonas halophila]|nr:radical SAM family heme chaperone HemW [Nitrosomonas halophila]
MHTITPLLSLSASKSPRLRGLPALSLYIHIPWCVRKCPYCDFNSHAINGRDGVPESEYVAALKRDLELSLPLIWGRPVVSVFFGGGTPSVFSAASIDAILSHVRMLLPLAPGTEITLEANPGTIEAQKFRDFQAAGINRLSIGIQSFNSRHLQALGRIHDGAEARLAAETALKYFDNLNLDLMYALPHQSLDQARQDIECAVMLGAPHISAYHLTIEPNTPFYRNPPRLPDEEVSADMQGMIETMLADNGYQHYEVSAFARPGQHCAHNMNYWQYGDYLGIGAGAHSKISFQDRIVRHMRYKHPRQYLEQALASQADIKDLIAVEQEVDAPDRIFEFMMNALRSTNGFDPGLLQAHTGLTTAAIQRQLAEAEQRGLIEWRHDCIRPTLQGRRFLNDLLEIFLPRSENQHQGSGRCNRSEWPSA